MKKRMRRLAWVGVALCAVALAFGVTERLLTPPPGVTEANVNRISAGMTLVEVRTLLGGPGECVAVELRDDLVFKEGPHDRFVHMWDGEAGYAWVGVDINGRVENTTWLSRPRQPSLRARQRALLGR